MGRREHIGDAGVGLIARDGVHALTHLQVDTEAGLPRGSTSYYARTRRDLLALVVNRLSEGSQADIDDLEIPASVSRQEAAEIFVGVLEHMARRADAQAARGALLFELRDDVEGRKNKVQSTTKGFVDRTRSSASGVDLKKAAKEEALGGRAAPMGVAAAAGTAFLVLLIRLIRR